MASLKFIFAITLACFFSTHLPAAALPPVSFYCKSVILRIGAQLQLVNWRLHPESYWNAERLKLAVKKQAGDKVWLELQKRFFNSQLWRDPAAVVGLAQSLESFIRDKLKQGENFDGTQRSKGMLFQIILEIRDNLTEFYNKSRNENFMLADRILTRVHDLLDQPIESAIIAINESTKEARRMERVLWIDKVYDRLKIDVTKASAPISTAQAEKFFRLLLSEDFSAAFFRFYWNLDFTSHPIDLLVEELNGLDLQTSREWGFLASALIDEIKIAANSDASATNIKIKMAKEFLAKLS